MSRGTLIKYENNLTINDVILADYGYLGDMFTLSNTYY